MTFTREHLVSFGNSLLKNYGVQVHSADGKNTPLFQRDVSKSDVDNWINDLKDYRLMLPSHFQIGASCLFFAFPYESPEHTFPGITADVIAVHFYEGKVKYDLNLLFNGNMSSRIYNVDSALVTERPIISDDTSDTP